MKHLISIVILAGAILVVAILIRLKPQPEEVTPERALTPVQVLVATPQSIRLTVKSQGTVLPGIESELAVEASGQIIEMSPNFRPGGRFTKGEVLFKIDPADYEAALATRKADLASAELTRAREIALAEQAALDWKSLGEGDPSDLTLRKPQLKQARAFVESAKAVLKQAKRELDQTEVRAPFDGLVLSKSVGLGQFVFANPGTSVARIYATEYAEVRLPLTQREAAYLPDPTERESTVTLLADGKTWTARLARFEASIDPTSRLLYAVAEIRDPFEQGIRRGLFVEATIEGREFDDVYVLPRFSLRGSDTVYVVTEENKLITRRVELLKTDDETAILSSGLAPGDKVATSPIAYFVEGMPVNVLANP